VVSLQKRGSVMISRSVIGSECHINGTSGRNSVNERQYRPAA
jgi:hypothetical protein